MAFRVVKGRRRFVFSAQKYPTTRVLLKKKKWKLGYMYRHINSALVEIDLDERFVDGGEYYYVEVKGGNNKG